MRPHRTIACAALLLGTALAPATALEVADGAVPLRIAVASFQDVAPSDAALPDVATLLADRLGAAGVEQVWGPTEVGALTTESSPGDVAGWAEKAKVDAVVLGRTTLVGRSLSIDVQVRDPKSGRSAATYVSEATDSKALPAAIERLSEQVLEGAQVAAVGLPAVAAARSGAGPAARASGDSSEAKSEDEEEERGSSGLFRKGNGPLDIKSEELEAQQSGNRRKFVFRRNVRVRQGDLFLRSAKLEAFYPPGQSQPEKLVATGNVRLSQEGRTVRCDEATYYRSKDRVFCRGNAVMSEDGDTVTGEEIEFHLDTERLFVRGRAHVQVAQDGPEEGAPQ